MQVPVAGIHIPWDLSGEGVLSTRMLAVPAYAGSGAAASVILLHDPVRGIKYASVYPSAKRMNAKPSCLQVRACSAE